MIKNTFSLVTSAYRLFLVAVFFAPVYWTLIIWRPLKDIFYHWWNATKCAVCNEQFPPYVTRAPHFDRRFTARRPHGWICFECNENLSEVEAQIIHAELNLTVE